ncbi:hypothetical protein V8E36_003737 [Tilletia maclaganii]
MQIASAFSRLSVALFLALAALLIAGTQPAEAVQAGLPWGARPQLATQLVRGDTNFKWYHNWGNSRPVSTLSKLNYVPTLWGPSKLGAWHSLERWYKNRGKRPKYILFFNEPDVPSQSNSSPKQAAKYWVREMLPWQRRGVKVSSAQICWDTTNWLDPFLRQLRNMGHKPNFCAAHYYGSATDLGRFKRYVRRVRSTCAKYGIHSLWLTEIGIMASTQPQQNEVNNFARESFQWLATQDYVKRAAWIGVFEYGSAYDGFMSTKNAYFSAGGGLRSLGRLMAYGNIRRRSMARASAHVQHIERSLESNGTLVDALAPLDDPRGQWDNAFVDDADDATHDANDDAFWDAKFAKQTAADPEVAAEKAADAKDLEQVHDDDDKFEDGFLAHLFGGKRGEEEEEEERDLAVEEDDEE